MLGLTLNRWITAHRDTDVVSVEDRELERENVRLRRENGILKDLRRTRKPSGFEQWPSDPGGKWFANGFPVDRAVSGGDP